MSLPRNQRFFIPANVDKIVKIMDEFALDISCATWSSALNACSRGAIRIGLDYDVESSGCRFGWYRQGG